MSMAKEQKKLAIFDIDGTIFRSSLVIELIKGLVKAGVFPKAALRETEEEYLAWVNRKGAYEAYINKVVKIYTKYIKGKEFSKVERVAKSVIACQKDRNYRFTGNLIKELKEKKYLLAAISGSPSYIVEEYAKKIGFDFFFGTQLEIKKGKFTGKILNLGSAFHKDVILNKILKNHPRINLKESIAVGDTEGDIQILSKVGRPIAFNPNLQLAKYAKKKNWEIVVERKDVLYKLGNFEFFT
jgi:HAD superfamily hydrolase (TIGR01490 family)